MDLYELPFLGSVIGTMLAYFHMCGIMLLLRGSPQLKCHLSGLLINVGECMITQTSKVRVLGVIFHKFLNLDDHYVEAHIFILET